MPYTVIDLILDTCCVRKLLHLDDCILNVNQTVHQHVIEHWCRPRTFHVLTCGYEHVCCVNHYMDLCRLPVVFNLRCVLQCNHPNITRW